MSKKDYIVFDEKTRATVVELKRNLDFFNAQITLVCQTVLNMNGQDVHDGWMLAPDLSGLVKVSESSKSNYENKNFETVKST